MTNHKFLLTAFFALGLMSSSTKAADVQAAQAFSEFGLLGTWAHDFAAPPNDTNWYVEYSSLPSGLVSRKHYKSSEPSFEY
jgi:hypothetical protein